MAVPLYHTRRMDLQLKKQYLYANINVRPSSQSFKRSIRTPGGKSLISQQRVLLLVVVKMVMLVIACTIVSLVVVVVVSSRK